MRISDWSSDVCSSDLSIFIRGVRHQFTDFVRLWCFTAPQPKPGGAARERSNTYCFSPFPVFPDFGSINPSLIEFVRILDKVVVQQWDHESNLLDLHRSEERRVGKEGVRTCRSRWS